MTDPFLTKNNPQSKNISQPQLNEGKVVKKVKKGKKLGMTQFLIGCISILVLFIVGGTIFLFYLASNPQILSQGGNLEGAKQTLKILGGIFFGLFILTGFLLTIGNIIKLIFSKTGKFKYLIGLIISIIILLSSLIGGLAFFAKIRKLPSNIIYQNISTIYPEIVLKDNFIPLEKLGNFIFAPIYIRFSANLQKLPPNIIGIKLNCGNGNQQFSIKILPSQKNQQLLPIGICYYTQKGIYKPTYTLYYLNGQNTTSQTFSIENINIKTQINLKINGKSNFNLPLNAFGDTINGGNAPVRLTADAGEIFVNYASYFEKGNINWDFNGDGKRDVVNKEKARYTYNQKGTYDIFVNFPELNNITFKIGQIRVNESDTPSCNITYKQLKNGKIIFNLNLPDYDETSFYIKKAYITNDLGEKVGKTKIFSKNKIIGFVNQPGLYILKSEIKLANQKLITCEKQFKYQSALTKLPVIIYLTNSLDKPYKKFKKIILYKTGIISITLPYKNNFLKLIIPTNNDNDINNITILDQNNNIINQPQKGTFLTTISEPTTLIIKVNYNNGENTKFELKFVPKPPKVIAHLKITPTHGYSPLNVTLDASQSEVLDPDDEILFFTWDFGDGSPIYKNVSRGIVNHIYRYDYTHQNGIFYPKVIITTKKGYKAIATGKVIVQQPPKQLKIISISHPTQIAEVGDSITFRIETDGQIKSIYWDFGNGSHYSCQGRKCINATTTYDEPGTYTVTATVEFYDYPSETASLKIKVLGK